MISVTANIDKKRLIGLPPYADRILSAAVKEGIEFGDTYMTSIVPRGDTQRLATAVEHHGPVTVAPGHFIGMVGVNQIVAPYADKVDRGTGIDGPFHAPVSILRPSRRNPKKPGMMQFAKRGEPIKYRRVVKVRPSLKIERGKNFSGRTYDAMVDWTRLRTGVIASELALYLQGSIK